MESQVGTVKAISSVTIQTLDHSRKRHSFEFGINLMC